MTTYHYRNNNGSNANNNNGNNSNNVLWMGDVDASMNEEFLNKCFLELNEPVEYVRIIRAKEGPNCGGSSYAFIAFKDEAAAQRVLNNWNGRQIPNYEGKRFKLNSTIRGHNHSQNRLGGKPSALMPRAGPGVLNGPRSYLHASRQPEFTAYIGDMTVEMDDEPFFKLFKEQYPSVHQANIMRTPEGISKGFAFVRFRDESEYKEALTHGQQISQLLGCSIRISKAHPRPTLSRRWTNPQHPFPNSGPRFLPPNPDPVQSYQGISQLNDQMKDEAVMVAEIDPHRLPQSTTSSHQQHLAAHPQPIQPVDMMQPVYYFPLPAGYSAYPSDSSYCWARQWPDFYPVIPCVPSEPHAQAPSQAITVTNMPGPQAGDPHLYSYGYTSGWHMPIQHPHQHQHQNHQDQRFAFHSDDCAGTSDTMKELPQKDQFQE